MSARVNKAAGNPYMAGSIIMRSMFECVTVRSRLIFYIAIAALEEKNVADVDIDAIINHVNSSKALNPQSIKSEPLGKLRKKQAAKDSNEGKVGKGAKSKNPLSRKKKTKKSDRDMRSSGSGKQEHPIVEEQEVKKRKHTNSAKDMQDCDEEDVEVESDEEDEE